MVDRKRTLNIAGVSIPVVPRPPDGETTVLVCMLLTMPLLLPLKLEAPAFRHGVFHFAVPNVKEALLLLCCLSLLPRASQWPAPERQADIAT